MRTGESNTERQMHEGEAPVWHQRRDAPHSDHVLLECCHQVQMWLEAKVVRERFCKDEEITKAGENYLLASQQAYFSA